MKIKILLSIAWDRQCNPTECRMPQDTLTVRFITNTIVTLWTASLCYSKQPQSLVAWIPLDVKCSLESLVHGEVIRSISMLQISLILLHPKCVLLDSDPGTGKATEQC